jgi:hypothetical protein
MKFYRINISGIGGEIVFGKATLQQYNFWNDPEHLMDAGFDETDDALTYYMTDKEEWEENIPKMARFDYEWFEIDEYGHYNGTTTDSAYIEVTEVESAEWNAPVVEDVYEGHLEKLAEQYEETIEQRELDLDDVLEERAPFVFYAISVEKGTFFNSVIETENDFDISKLKFYAHDLPNGDNILLDVEYDNNLLSNDGGDTVSKSLEMDVWEW